MLRRSAAAELAPKIASPTALFFWPGAGAVRRAESTVVPGEQHPHRASVNALGRRLEVGTVRLVLPTSAGVTSASVMNFLARLLKLLFGFGTVPGPAARGPDPSPSRSSSPAPPPPQPARPAPPAPLPEAAADPYFAAEAPDSAAAKA